MSALVSIIRRFYSTDRMVRPEQVRGEIIGTGDAYKTLIRIALPSVLELVLMSLIGAADTIMVAALGPAAIAAVSLTGQPRMIVLSIFFALNIGVTAIVARRKGQDRQEDANRTLRNALVMGFALSLVVMVLALAFARPLLLLAGANEDMIGWSVEYFTILAWFLPINALTMCINAAQRGVGNTKLAMYVNLTANTVNIIFNYLLIGGNFGFPRLEVAGAAYATGIGFVVGFVLCIISLYQGRRRNHFLRITRTDSWRLDKPTVASIVKIGGSAMWEQLGLRIGFFAYAAIVASLGTEVFAAHAVAMTFLNISFNFGDGVGIAGTSLVGQMLGKERPDLSVVYGKCSQRIAITVSLGLAAVFISFRYLFVGFFVNPVEDANVYLMAVNLMFMVAAFQPVQTSSIVISGCLRGAGDNLYVSLVMAICVVLIRPVLSSVAIFALGWGIMGAWGASIMDTTTRFILVYRRFNGGKWHDRKV